MSNEDIEEVLSLLKQEVGVDELPEDLVGQIEDRWPEVPDESDLFTQDDVDDIVERRLAREREAHESEVGDLKEQMEDMVDPEDHKELQEKFDSISGKAEERVAKAEKREKLVREATKAGIREDAIDDLPKLVDMESIEYNDGEVEGVDSVMENLKENKPFLLESEDEESSGGTDFGGEGDETDFFTKEQVEEMSEKEIRKNIDKVNESSQKW